VLVVLLWSALGGIVVLLGSHFGQRIELCLFKHLTGLACPTCGFMRGAMCLLHGQVVRAWLYNPLLFSTLTLFFAAIVIQLLFGRGVQIHLTHKERIITWVLAITLFLANWVYVIFYIK